MTPENLVLIDDLVTGFILMAGLVVALGFLEWLAYRIKGGRG